MKRSASIKGRWQPYSVVLGLLAAWQLASSAGLVERFVLPPPTAVAGEFLAELPILAEHGAHTVLEAFLGLALSFALGYAFAIAMDRFAFLEKALHPVLVLSQTVPFVAMAPLLVLWLGFGMAPKVALVTLTCFFPVAVNVRDGIRGIGPEYLDELRVMGGTYLQGLVHVKVPMGLRGFFTALRTAVTYSFVGALVAEWMGGSKGLGVYMTRVRKSYEFGKMFAVILFVAVVSLAAMGAVRKLEGRVIERVGL
ncbi:MAG: ABC transporter permease [Oscillospiraceae bacterium]|nr:ABC transporter permease [Oscillospiraceae bacterium]